jgi:hypothetical protein
VVIFIIMNKIALMMPDLEWIACHCLLRLGRPASRVLRDQTSNFGVLATFSLVLGNVGMSARISYHNICSLPIPTYPRYKYVFKDFAMNSWGMGKGSTRCRGDKEPGLARRCRGRWIILAEGMSRLARDSGTGRQEWSRPHCARKRRGHARRGAASVIGDKS